MTFDTSLIVLAPSQVGQSQRIRPYHQEKWDHGGASRMILWGNGSTSQISSQEEYDMDRGDHDLSAGVVNCHYFTNRRYNIKNA